MKRKQTEMSDQVISFIGESERFSPTGISQKFQIDLSVAYTLCETCYKFEPERFSKWYRIICPVCNSITNSSRIEELASIHHSNCGECLNRFEVDSSCVQIFYVNSRIEKSGSVEEVDSEDLSIKRRAMNKVIYSQATSLDILESLGSDKIKLFKNKNKNFIWHISDLHISGTRKWMRWPGHGHSELLLDKFIDVAKQRGTSLNSDILIISGDITDTGHPTDVSELKKFVRKLIGVGFVKENIFFIPGNHDAWCGSGRFMTGLKSFWQSESKILKKAVSYGDREYYGFLKGFNKNNSLLRYMTINSRDLSLLLVNTTVPHSIAKGIFPVNPLTPTKNKNLKIAVMHHHLIKPDTKDYQYSKNIFQSLLRFLKKAVGFIHDDQMRVINHTVGQRYLYGNSFDISLHGHKHLQYLKVDGELNSTNTVAFVSCPSLSEDNFDSVRGSSTEKNKIGLNLLIPTAKSCEVIQLELKDWNFVPVRNLTI